MFLYLAPYVGVGTEDDPFRPRGSEQEGWSAIDVRRDCTVVTGRALLSVPVRDDTIGTYLGDAPDEVSATIKSAIENRFGITLAATRLRQIIPELLIAHAREDGTRWRPLRAMHDGMFRVYLGGLWWQAKSLSGGSTITESFNTADSDTLGPDLSWTELVGDIDIVSNAAKSITTGSECIARADSDLATSNVYSQASVNYSGTSNPTDAGIIVRKDSSATLTFYLAASNYRGASNQLGLWKSIAGTYTNLSSASFTFTPPHTVRCEASGSSLTLLMDGAVKIGPVTNTAIAAGTRCGLRGYIATAGSYVTWDSFEAGDLAVAGEAAHGAMYPRMQRHIHQSWTVPRVG